MRAKEVDWLIIRKVLIALRDGPHHGVDCEEIVYHPERFAFSEKEFNDAYYWIEEYASSRDAMHEISNDPFPEIEAHFTYEGSHYILGLLLGQGSFTSLACDPDGSACNKEKAFVLDERQILVPGYHLKKIPKGTVGEWSKVEEEFAECLDAKEQGIRIMLLVELADLMGAIDAYVEKHYKMSLKDLRKMAKVTKRAFKSGKRT